MNKQVEFGLKVRKEFAECFDFDSWEKFVAFQEKMNGIVGKNLVKDLEEMVECSAEIHVRKEVRE